MDESEKHDFALEFYSRQRAMKEFSSREQNMLLNSKVAVVGVGG